MNAQELQEYLTPEQIFDLLAHLDGDPMFIEDGVIIARTICHGGDSRKLYYYENSGRFTCYTGGCGYGFSVFDLICMVRDCSFIESLNFIKSFFGIAHTGYTKTPKKERIETDFFKNFMPSGGEDKTVIPYDTKILSCFYDIYHHSWLEDGISSEAMQKYGIKYSILDNQIVIPHFSKDSELIGVRVRNLNKDIVESGRKYMPLIYGGEMYNHDTGKHLYGLNITKEYIKKKGKIILFESEKSCMQLETMFPGRNIGVALSGSNFSKEQFDIISELNVDEVVIALDKEFIDVGSKREKMYQREIRRRFIDKLLPYHKVSVLWDWKGLLNEKDSPSDKGKEVFMDLYTNRLRIIA